MNVTTTPWFDVVINLVFLTMGINFFITFIRLAKGPSVADRVVALDLIAALAVGVIALYAVATETSLYIDCALALALVAFLSTVAFAQYLMRRRGDQHE